MKKIPGMPKILLTTKVHNDDFQFFFGDKRNDFNNYFYFPENAYTEFLAGKVITILEYSDTVLSYGEPFYGKTWVTTVNLLLDEINSLLDEEILILLVTEEHYLAELVPFIIDHFEKVGLNIYDIRFADNLYGGRPLPKEMYAPIPCEEFLDEGSEENIDQDVISEPLLIEDHKKSTEHSNGFYFTYLIVPLLESSMEPFTTEYDKSQIMLQ